MDNMATINFPLGTVAGSAVGGALVVRRTAACGCVLRESSLQRKRLCGPDKPSGFSPHRYDTDHLIT